MFEDRKDAGQKLAVALKDYKDKEDVIVLAIPKGGVEVGYEVAKYLNARFSVVIARKFPFPDNPESGFGAVAEDGSTFIFDFAQRMFSQAEISKILRKHEEEIKRRIRVLRKGKDLPELKDKTVILVDDGIAMGSTMFASVQLCKNRKVKKIIVAAPVSSRQMQEQLKSIVDEVIILENPPFFQAVAEVYRNWYDVSDEEVIEILKKGGEDVKKS
jgi:predicted phosphoribosyltransferase